MTARRLLIIAYHFVPEPTAGAQRPFYLARELGRRGWDVTVLTREVDHPPSYPQFRIVRSGSPLGDVSVPKKERDAGPFSWLPKPMVATLRQVVFFPDRTVGWIPRTTLKALELTAAERFDAIFSTSMPPSVHIAAAWCAGRRNLPWVADYRDLWTGNPYVNESALRRRLQRALEVRTLRGAAAITTVSPALAHSLEALHGRPISVVMNAFDPEEWAGSPQIAPTSFDLTFTGRLYDGKRRPDALFEAIRRLRAAGEPAGTDATLHFYGEDQRGIADLAQRYGLGGQVVLHGRVSRSEAMNAQRAAAVLLILLNQDPATAEEYGSKVFEYAGAGRPILAIGPQASVLRKFIATHELGEFASDADEVTVALRLLYDRFRRGSVVATADLPFSPSKLADAFQAIIESAVLRPGDSRRSQSSSR